MSEISAPPPPPPVPPGGQPPPPPPTAITLPPAQSSQPIPQAILEAALGARFDLQVTGLGDRGTVDLNGQAGRLQVQLQTLLNLNPGDTLTLQLNGRGAQLQFIIAAINGQSPSAAQKPAPGATQPGAQAAPQGPAQGLPAWPNLAPGNVLTATLLRPAPGIPAPPAAPASSPGAGGTAATATPASGPGSSPGPGTAQPTGQAGSNPAGPLPAAPSGGGAVPAQGPGAAPASTGAQAPSPVTLPAGTQFTVQITAVEPPPPGGAAAIAQTPGPSGTQAALGQTIPGVVTANLAGGQPIVDTPLGPISLAGSNPPPEGSRVVLNVTGAPLPPAQPEPIMDSQQLFLRQALFVDRHWPALNQAIEQLANHAPNAAQQVLQTAIPRPDANLAANVLFFLSALRGGDLRSWFGDGPTRVLQRVNPGLLGRLREDMTQLSRLADEPTTGDWRTAMVPFVNGEQLDQIRLFIRNQDEQDDDGESGPGTRFVVDVTLSRLGHIQLDGLVDTAHKRLDMVVRSDDHLPADMKNDIRRLYEQSGEITGYRGGVGFQSQPAGFVEVAPPAPAPDGGGVGLVV